MMSSPAIPTTFSSFEVELSAADEWSHQTKRLFLVAASLASWTLVLVPIYALLRLF
jgi:hypothetical protein